MTKPKTFLIYDAYVAELGYKPNGPKKELAGAKRLKDYDIADIVEYYRELKAQNFWRAKHLSLTYIAQNIAAWSQPRTKPMSVEEGDEWFRQNNPTG